MLKNKVFQNAAWMIVCRVVQALLNFVVVILTARFLGPSNYGLVNYAASLVAFVLPITQLGLNNVLVQEVILTPDEEGKIFGTSIFMSVCSALACMVALYGAVNVLNPGEPVTIVVCMLYSFVLIFQALELLQYWFQAKYLSKVFSLVSLGAFTVVAAYRIFLLATGKSIYWFAVSNAIDYMLIAFALLFFYKKLGGEKLSFSWQVMKRMFAKSRHYIVSSLMVTIFAQTDKIMLKLMIDDAATGYYTAAVSCASMTSFVFVAIIDAFRPAIFEEKKVSQEKYENNMITLYSLIIYFSLAQCLFLTIFAKPVILILYGETFSPAIPALQLNPKGIKIKVNYRLNYNTVLQWLILQTSYRTVPNLRL